jgi:hypothetical protein
MLVDTPCACLVTKAIEQLHEFIDIAHQVEHSRLAITPSRSMRPRSCKLAGVMTPDPPILAPFRPVSFNYLECRKPHETQHFSQLLQIALLL